MDFLLPIFQLIYFVVHFLYSLGQAVLDCFHELYHIISSTFWWKNHFLPDSRQLLQDASKLKKLPRHLGLIFMPKQTNHFKHVCHLMNWSLGFGIHNMSLYDVDGIFKLKLPTLLDNLSQVCLNVTVKVIVDGQVFIRECNSSSSRLLNCNISSINVKELKSDSNRYAVNSKSIALHEGTFSESNYTNILNSKPTNTLTLNIFCLEDGKEDIVKLTKTVCEKEYMLLDSDFINRNLITKGQIDPDLAVIIGRPICSLGFLPWQIRLTEFLNVPSISRLDYFEFRKLLQIYSKCEQRLGS